MCWYRVRHQGDVQDLDAATVASVGTDRARRRLGDGALEVVVGGVDAVRVGFGASP